MMVRMTEDHEAGHTQSMIQGSLFDQKFRFELSVSFQWYREDHFSELSLKEDNLARHHEIFKTLFNIGNFVSFDFSTRNVWNF